MSLLFYTYFLHTIVLVIAQKEGCRKGEDGGPIRSNGIGTVLFTAADEFKQCWSPDEIAILTARMIMEDLLPNVSILNIDSNGYADDIVGYFRLLIEVVKKSTRGRKKRITLLVLTDILGGYLQYAVLPIARRAFYAGLIDYNSMEKLIQLFEELKWFLRTNGQGWSKPVDRTPDFDVQQIDFETETPKVKNCCQQLIFFEYEHRVKQDNKSIIKSDIAYPMPVFDTNVKPSSIAVPFKRFALRNIESRRASYLLLKFFITAWQCLHDKSSTKDARLKFQNTFFTWLQANVVPKTKDNKFYSAFGGVFRVIETLKSMGAVTHTESTCPPEGEEEMAVPNNSSKRSFTSTVVMVVMLVIIFIWFIIGTAFICLRMSRKKKGDEPPKKPDYTSTEESKWSVVTKPRTDSKTDSSIGICKCSTSRSSAGSSSLTSEYEIIDDKHKKKRSKPRDKSVTICYPPFMAPYVDNNKPAVIETKTTMKRLPSIEEMTEITSYKNNNRGNHPRIQGDDSAISKTSDDKRGGRKSKKDYDTSIPCKRYPPTSGTSSSRRPSWESVKKKIKPGMTIDECWCDVLQEEETEGGSDNQKKATRRPSVEFSDSVQQKGGSNRGRRGANDYATTMDDSNLGDSQKEDRTLPSRMTTAGEESPRSRATAPESTDSGATDKEGASPHTYACHSSLTGAYAKDKARGGKPYIFGYDFQSSTSSDLSEEETTDAKTPTSK